MFEMFMQNVQFWPIRLLDNFPNPDTSASPKERMPWSKNLEMQLNRGDCQRLHGMRNPFHTSTPAQTKCCFLARHPGLLRFASSPVGLPFAVGLPFFCLSVFSTGGQ